MSEKVIVTLEFNSKEEAAAFLSGSSAPAAPAPAKSKKGKAAAAPVAAPEAEEMEEVPSPFAVPPVIDEKPAFDRNAALEGIKVTLSALNELGLPDEQLSENIQQAIAHAGCPAGVQISKMEDEHLGRLAPVLAQLCANISNHLKSQKAKPSFL